MEREGHQGETVGGRARGLGVCMEETLQLGLGALGDPPLKMRATVCKEREGGKGPNLLSQAGGSKSEAG